MSFFRYSCFQFFHAFGLCTGQKFCQEEQSEPKSNRSSSVSSDESIAHSAMDEEENRFDKGAALPLVKFLSSTEAFGPFLPQFFRPTFQSLPQKLRKNELKIKKKLTNSNSGRTS